MKEIILTLLSLTILLSLRLPVASAQGKVYGDADIRKYKSSSDEASYEYNPQIQ